MARCESRAAGWVHIAEACPDCGDIRPLRAENRVTPSDERFRGRRPRCHRPRPAHGDVDVLLELLGAWTPAAAMSHRLRGLVVLMVALAALTACSSAQYTASRVVG